MSMWILDVILVLLIVLIILTVLFGFLEWKSDPVEFFEPEKKVKYDVPIFTTDVPSKLDKLLGCFE
ncbi:hypothetical protein LOSG293_110510 [Secundilactobacillus oryzae JCM 18671]|uniref:Uncharacterized protein n=1 Tax=Secundilactobacillus oryzae JCM 18671 TaxID=1291743 RepID=A0A081BI67_9LACO|nr:hypothetical protein [Secundilactobacillus oryzae]GAK47735.1 hypothetical protein LOSG293_110510 [Secundilactobacillus oryzae JCM 18671]